MWVGVYFVRGLPIKFRQPLLKVPLPEMTPLGKMRFTMKRYPALYGVGIKSGYGGFILPVSPKPA